MKMEEAYRLSQQRAVIEWQQQTKGENKSERNTIIDIKLHTAMFTSENENTGLRFLAVITCLFFCQISNLKII